MKKNNIIFLLTALAVIIMDQVSKFIISRNIANGSAPIPIINGLFDVTHRTNSGMAFSLKIPFLSDEMFLYFLIAVTIIAVVLIIIWSFKLKESERGLRFGLSLILGGAVGNLIDRIRFKEVIDFLDVYLGSYHWPAFNVADSAITVGAIWIAVCIVFFSPSRSRGDGG